MSVIRVSQHLSQNHWEKPISSKGSIRRPSSSTRGDCTSNFPSGPCEYSLVGGFNLPLWKILISQLGLSFAIYGNIWNIWKMFQTTNQIYWNVIWDWDGFTPIEKAHLMPLALFDASRCWLGIRTMQQNHQLSIFGPAGLSQLVVLDLGTATWSSSHWKSSSIRLRHLIPPNSEWQKQLKIHVRWLTKLPQLRALQRLQNQSA